MGYKQSGVDIEKGDEFVKRIQKKVRSTYGPRVVEGIGGFASLFKGRDDHFLAAATDGVGTKILLAKKCQDYSSIGIDLVAMCANDLICTGATPLFFLDYIACVKLDLKISQEIIDGIVEGCRQSSMALIGGETAEMPGVYSQDDCDLAGFAVGEVHKDQVLDGKKIKIGDSLIGIRSSGIHSNGLSLFRQLAERAALSLWKEALTPTRIYVSLAHKLLHQSNFTVKGMAHITGGGVQNISRVNQNFNYEISNWPKYNQIPKIFSFLSEALKFNQNELFKTFNMGIGLVLVVDEASKCLEYLQSIGEEAFFLGNVSAGNGKVLLADRLHE